MNSIILNKLYDLFGYNEKLFIAINHYSNIDFFAHVSLYLSEILAIQYFPLYYLLAVSYVYLRYKNTDLIRSEGKFLTIYFQFLEIGNMIALIGFIYAYLKFTINMPRPLCAMDSSRFVTIMESDIAAHVSVRCLSSFPSAHTALALITVYFLWQHSSTIYRILLVLFFLAVVTSRITLAMHYPSDILYSILAVILLIWINKFLIKFLHNRLLLPIGLYIHRRLNCQEPI